MSADEDSIEAAMLETRGIVWSERAIRHLLDTRGDLNVYDDFHITPLHWAANKGKLALANELLSAGANPNCPSGLHFKSTPLHFAAEEDNTEMTRLLIAHGADADREDHKGRQPMHWAIAANRVEQVRILMQHTSKLAVERRNFAYPLDLAIGSGAFGCAEILMAQSWPHGKSLEEHLWVAAEWKRVEAVTWLLEHGASEVATGPMGLDALGYAELEIDDYERPDNYEIKRSLVIDILLQYKRERSGNARPSDGPHSPEAGRKGLRQCLAAETRSPSTFPRYPGPPEAMVTHLNIGT